MIDVCLFWGRVRLPLDEISVQLGVLMLDEGVKALG